MILRYFLPILALFGIIHAFAIANAGNQPIKEPIPLALPAEPPFPSFVAGAGIVESSSEDIAIGTQVSGVVENVFVTLGQKVKKGDPLFKLDDRTQLAELEVRRANFEDVQSQLLLWTNLSDPRAVSKENLDRKKYAVQFAKARLQQAETDVAIRTVRAPIDGEILRIKIRSGEFATSGVTNPPLITMGNTDILHVRIDVDENDAWRVKENQKAVAFIRGNSSLKTDLKFVRFEPYVIPKRSLTGESSERVDTRVLQVIYSFPKENLPVYVGQLMDAYIEAPPL